MIFDLHNEVNVAVGKRVYHKSFEQVRDFYERFRASDCSKMTKPAEAVEAGCHTPMHGNASLKCMLSFVNRDTSLPEPVTISVTGPPRGLRMRRDRDGAIFVSNNGEDATVPAGAKLISVDGAQASWRALKDAIDSCRTGGTHEFGFARVVSDAKK